MKKAAELDTREIMTLRDVADYLDCHVSTAYRLVRRGDLPAFHAGGSWRFRRSELDAWIARRQASPRKRSAPKPERRGRKRRSGA